MSWFFVAVVAYFLTAINSVTDKFLLGKHISNPLAYSFYVGIFSAFVLVMFPFGVEWPGFYNFSFDILVGAIYLFALIAFFYALHKDEASRVVPLVGAATPIFILIMSNLFLGEIFGLREMTAFAFLVLGGFIISWHKNTTHDILNFKNYSLVSGISLTILASFIFALFFVMTKHIFNTQDFLSGFVFTRLGSVVAAVLLLLVPLYRKSIHKTTKKVNRKAGGIFIANKTLAGIAFFLVNYAVAIGSPTLVNALEGVKYAFVFLIILIISKKFPHIMKEHVSFYSIIQKSFAIVLIFSGIFILFKF